MKNNKIDKLKRVLYGVFSVIAFLAPSVLTSYVIAEKGITFTVSPMKEKIILNPGEEYHSSLEIYIQDKYENDIKYTIEVTPFFVDENYRNDFDNTHGVNNEIVKWISFESPMEGRLSPGQKTIIEYTINVPEDAPGGGQYAAIMVTADMWHDENSGNDTKNNEDNEVNAGIKEVKKIGHTIFAEVTGNVIRQGEITDINVPSFLLSGNITGSASVKNTGNIHGDAKYKLQVFPLFSNEEIYTNEEDPQNRTILPDRTLYNETPWEQTPGIGIFNVKYTVEFEGATAQVSKMVIVCPIWLLFIILFAIFALIFYFIAKSKVRKKANNKTTN